MTRQEDTHVSFSEVKRMKMNKPQYYDEIPEVPQDFQSACSTLATANSAIHYWNEEIKTIDKYLYERLYNEARSYLAKWRKVKAASEAVIATFQLKLF